MTTQFYTSLAICLVGLAIRTTYEILKKRGEIDPRNKVVFAVVFAGMVLMLISWFFMGMSDPWRVQIPVGFKWVGILLIATGLVLAFGGLFQLRGLENIDHLVKDGVYTRIRHPMYTGFILFILGWVIYFGALASLVAAGIAILNILYWRHLEEIKLEADYGSEYLQYQKQTWF